jgi:hypothetical protein
MKLDLTQASWIGFVCLAVAVTCAHEGWALTVGAGAPIAATVDSNTVTPGGRGGRYVTLHVHDVAPGAPPLVLSGIEPADGKRYREGDPIRLYRAPGWFDAGRPGVVIEEEIASRRSWGIALFVVAALSLVGVFFAALWIWRHELRRLRW